MAKKLDPDLALYAAINAVMQEVGFVHKDGKIQGGAKYKFVGEAALLKALRPSMVAHGLMLFPVSYEMIEHTHDRLDNGYGKLRGDHLATVHATYRLVHVDGHYIQVQAIGTGHDFGDKQVNKAMTIAFKYALRQLFMIETGDDPDRHASGASQEEMDRAEREQARRERVQKRYREVTDAGYVVPEVDRFLAFKSQPSIAEMTEGRFAGTMKRLRAADGQAKFREYIDSTGDQNSTDRASDAMGDLPDGAAGRIPHKAT